LFKISLHRIHIIVFFVFNHLQRKLLEILFKISSKTNLFSLKKINIYFHSILSLTKDNRRNNGDIFLDLTTDYNRKRFVQSDLITNAIKNINSTISERLSLLILTAAARCVHHVTPEKRVQLLEEVI
jgi:hypothetical protein